MEGEPPLLVETDEVGSGAEEEIAEFKQLVDELAESPEKQRVLHHLRRTTAVVAIRVPAGGAEDDALNAAGVVLGLLVQHWNALVQADGEGFYEGPELILELE